MKKFRQSFFSIQWLIFCIGLLAVELTAQVNINVQLPPGGMIQKESLWNLVLINSKEGVLNVSIKMTLQDVQSGQVIMSASSGNIILGKGIKVITNADVQPVIYNYNMVDLAGSFLPMGAYIVCYQVYTIRGEFLEPMSNECVRMNIDPLSPPLLSTPEDKSTVQSPYPFFTWMPPAPADMFSDLNYDIIVTEVVDGQSATEAIDYNTPIYTRSNLRQTNENYAAGFTKLDTGKTYAWQVIAKNGFKYSAKTAVWTFSVNKENKPVASNTYENYLLVDNALKGLYVITTKKLHVKFVSFDKEHTVPIVILNENENKLLSIDKRIVPGDNYFDIDLNNQFHKDGIYKVIITEAGRKSHAISFTIK